MSFSDGSNPVTQEFDPFGGSTTDPSVTRIGFTGQEHDTDLGLIDMHGRIYDPLAGRFCSQDPIAQDAFGPQGLNRYSYVFNDPINATDPSGYLSNDANGFVFFLGFVGGFFGGPLAKAAPNLVMGLGNAAMPAASQGISSLMRGGGVQAGGTPIPIHPTAAAVVTSQDAGGYQQGGTGQSATGHEVPAQATLRDVAKGVIIVAVAVEAVGPAAARAGVAAAAERGWFARKLAALKAFLGLERASTAEAPSPRSVGAMARGSTRVLQTGGNTIRPATARALNASTGRSLARREWGRALESLKDEHGLANDFHGQILENGEYLGEEGETIDSLLNYLP